jgi:hypothetical protein
MKRIFRLLFPLLCALAAAQVPVTPIIQPHMTFLNNSGLACAGCSLYSYAAGTTTPLPTFTDSTGTGQNTNPIILGADGGANIWLSAGSYKLVLKDVGGSTLFSVDNVTTAGLSACATAGAIVFENSSTNGLTCDSTITINSSAHTINVGTLSAAHASILALGTPTAWTFDVTTPATALASLGATSFPYPGVGIPNSTGTSWGTSYGVSGTGSVALTNGATLSGAAIASATTVQILSGTAMTANQGNGTKVQHSTGSTTTNNCGKFDVNGNIVDAGTSCAAGSGSLITPNGYFTIAGGLIVEWMQGSLQSDISGGSGVAPQVLTYPLACPTAVLSVNVATLSPGETEGDDTHGPNEVLVSSTNTTATTQRYRLADHGSDPSAPIVWVICH